MIVRPISDEHFEPWFRYILFSERQSLKRGEKISETEQRMPIKRTVLYFFASVIFACSMEMVEYGISLVILYKKEDYMGN